MMQYDSVKKLSISRFARLAALTMIAVFADVGPSCGNKRPAPKPGNSASAVSITVTAHAA